MGRSRNRNEGKDLSYTYRRRSYTPAGVLVPGSEFNLPRTNVFVFSRQENIQDIEHGLGQFNPCTHSYYRGNATEGAVTFWMGDNTSNPLFQVNYYGPVGMLTYAELLGMTPLGPEGSLDLQRFVYTSFLDMTSEVPISVSLPNFLFELREVKDLIPKLEGFMKSISGGYLNLQFGWLPMIGDIKKLLRSAEDARKRIAELKKLNKKVTKLHRSASLDLGFVPSSMPSYAKSQIPWGMSPETEAPPYLFSHGNVSAIKCIATVTLEVYYDLSGLDAQDAFLKTMLTSLGFCNAPKALWNAIPFSWLLEYFVNLDKILNAFDNKPFEGQVLVKAAGTSIKTSAVIESGGYVAPSIQTCLLDEDVDFTVFQTYYVEQYSRQLGIDLGADIFLNESLSKGQLAILAALLHQKWG